VRSTKIAALLVAASLLAGRTVQGVEIDGGTPASDIGKFLNGGDEKLPEAKSTPSASADTVDADHASKLDETTRFHSEVLTNHERVGNLQDERLDGQENLLSIHGRRLSALETRETVKVGGKTIVIVRRGNKVVRIIRQRVALGKAGHRNLWGDAHKAGVVSRSFVEARDAQTLQSANAHADDGDRALSGDISGLADRVNGVSAISWIALALAALALGFCAMACMRRTTRRRGYV